jgi:hypothetical protein
MRIVPRREHDSKRRRPTGQQQLELVECLARGQFVEIIDDQDHAAVDGAQIGQQPVHHGAAVELG